MNKAADMTNNTNTSIAQVLAYVTANGSSYESDLCAAGVVRGEFGITALAVRQQVIPAMIECGALEKSFDSLSVPVFTAVKV